MTTQEEQPLIHTLDEYRAYISDRIGSEDPEAVESAMRFRVWNGNFDYTVKDSAARAEILGALRMDGNLRYQILD